MFGYDVPKTAKDINIICIALKLILNSDTEKDFVAEQADDLYEVLQGVVEPTQVLLAYLSD